MRDRGIRGRIGALTAPARRWVFIRETMVAAHVVAIGKVWAASAARRLKRLSGRG